VNSWGKSNVGWTRRSKSTFENVCETINSGDRGDSPLEQKSIQMQTGNEGGAKTGRRRETGGRGGQSRYQTILSY